MDKENLKINFKNNQQRMEFDPLAVIEKEAKDSFPVPEIMNGDRKKMGRFLIFWKLKKQQELWTCTVLWIQVLQWRLTGSILLIKILYTTKKLLCFQKHCIVLLR